MANALTPMSPTYWSKNMGKKRFKTAIYRSLASFEEQSVLTNGLTVDRPYRANLRVSNYTKGTAATAQDLTASSDTLTISFQKTILMYIDDVDKIQNKWDAARAWGEEAGKRIAEIEDAYFLYEVVNANNTIDDGDFGGTSGQPVTVTVSNIASLIGKVNRKLDSQNVGLEDRFLALSPQIKEVLWSYIAGKESILGDKTGENGNIGRYGGLDLFLTNNLTASAIWTPANNPTNADTITISGVVFTFVSTIGTTAGNVLQTVSTAQTITNLVTLINAPSVTTANGVAFAGADLDTVSNMVAVDGTTYILVYHKGQSSLTVAGSDGTDVWSKKTQHVLGGAKKSIDMVVQKEPDLSSESMASTIPNGKRGMNIMPLCLFGLKTFNQGKNEIVNVKVATALFS